jgi:BMFP domain-containing protein YqiC
MLNQKFIDDVSAKLKDLFAQSPAADIEKNLRALLQSGFAKLDLVTREEFDVQQEVLARTREKLTQLEAKVTEMEKSHETKVP